MSRVDWQWRKRKLKRNREGCRERSERREGCRAEHGVKGQMSGLYLRDRGEMGCGGGVGLGLEVMARMFRVCGGWWG